MIASNQKLRIDIASDVMCPWCLIGYLQLKKALEQTNSEYELQWHPFELNPNMPNEGQNVREHLMEKYGISVEQSKKNREHITQSAKELGFNLNFSDDMTMYNTFNTHQLLLWALTEYSNEKQHALKMTLFQAHFTDNRDLSDKEVLADIANSVGLDSDQALKVIEDQRYADEVRQEEAYFTQQGISGVPAIIFNNRHLVTGAQGVDNFVEIIEQLSKADG